MTVEISRYSWEDFTCPASSPPEKLSVRFSKSQIHMVSPQISGIKYLVCWDRKNRRTVTYVVATGAVLVRLSQSHKTDLSAVFLTACAQFLTGDLVSSPSGQEKNCMQWKRRDILFSSL